MATYPSLWQLLQALRRLSCKHDPLNCSSSVATAVNLAAFCLVLPLLGGSSTIHGQSSQSQWFSFPAFPQTWQLLATSCPWGRASGCWQWIRKASVGLWVSLDFRKPPQALQEGSSWQWSRSRHCFRSPRDSPLTQHRPGQHQRLGNRLQLISNSTHGPALIWAASEIPFPSYKYLDAPCAWAEVPWFTDKATGCPQRLPSTGWKGERYFHPWTCASSGPGSRPGLERYALQFHGQHLTSLITVLPSHSSRHQVQEGAAPRHAAVLWVLSAAARTRAEPGFHMGVWSLESLPESSSALSYGTGQREKVEGYLRA